jgi:hypothetical protein
MASKVKRILLRPISISERFGSKPVMKCSLSRFKLKRRLKNEKTDNLLPLLLRVMDLFLCLFKDYQKNIEDFEGQYFLATREGSFKSGVIFGDGYMKIPEGDIPFPDVKITFKDPESLLRFILSRDQDMLNWVLENRIEINGNFNLALKFWFMVRELKQRLGLGT